MPDLVDPSLSARWLAHARRGALAAQVALMAFAEATEVHLHSPPLVAVVVGWAVVDVAGALWARRRAIPRRFVVVSATVDLVTLTAILLLAGGQHSPLLFGYLAYVALLAMVLPAAQAWGLSALAMLLQALVVSHPVDVPGLPRDDESMVHLVGHVVTFDLSAAAITWVVTRLSAALRERGRRDREEERQREVTARLAALGTLAAGVAHELGTPLGAIQLLAEQARRRDDTDPALGKLLEQVARCRSMLDRLRGRDAPGGADSVLDLQRWVDEWRRAAPEVEVVLPTSAGGPTAAPRVVGPEESWRTALWVALDNARRAGARRVVLEVDDRGGAIAVAVEDDGAGLDGEAAQHAGEPFWTGWGGTGLGLFVSRSFAQSVGGDVLVEPLGSRGARTRLIVPRAPS
jgi:two-component system sensor histidine kinase RegB